MSYLRIGATVVVIAASMTTTSALSEPRLGELGDARLVFALGGEQQGLYVLNPLSHREYRLTHGADSDPRWSPDGRFIAFTRMSRDQPLAIWILDYRSGSIRRIATGGSPVWSANGVTLYFLCYFKSLCIRQQPTASHGRLAKEPLPVFASEIDRSRNGRFVLSTLAGELWIWNIGAKARKLTPGGLDFDSHPRVSADGASVLFTRTADDGQSRIESINLHNAKRQLVSHPGRYYSDDNASWIPRSNRIVFVRSVLHRSTPITPTSNPVIETMTRDGQVLSRLKAVHEPVVDLDWRP